MNQIDFLKLSHLPEGFCCIRRNLRLCNQAQLQTSQTSFYRIFPFLILNIEQVCKNPHLDCSSIQCRKLLLQGSPGLCQYLRIGFAIVFHIVQKLLLFLQVFGQLPLLLVIGFVLFLDILAFLFQTAAQLQTLRLCHRSGAKCANQIQQPVADIVRNDLVALPSPQSLQDFAPLCRVIRQHPASFFQLFQTLLTAAKVAAL